MSKHVLFGTSAWGLGHATRDLVLMRALLQAGCRLTVVATGSALRVLRQELGDRARFLDWPDMPTSVAATSAGFYAKTVAHIPKILGTWFAEQRRTRALLAQQPVDLIVSDHRYGMVTSQVPCYFMTHSPRYVAPWRDWFMEAVMERFMAHWLAPVRKVLIPDDEEGGLSGDMSHHVRFLPKEKLVYLGMLSSVRRRPAAQDVDVFISISGPEPQRTRMQETVLGQVGDLPGRITVALGVPDGMAPSIHNPRVELHPYLNRTEQEAMMNRSAMVVCRSGYTTLMELAELGKRALLVPTPGQTEQLYLAKTLRERGLFHSVKQHQLRLSADLALARQYPGYAPAHPSDRSAQRFLEAVLGKSA